MYLMKIVRLRTVLADELSSFMEFLKKNNLVRQYNNNNNDLLRSPFAQLLTGRAFGTLIRDISLVVW